MEVAVTYFNFDRSSELAGGPSLKEAEGFDQGSVRTFDIRSRGDND